MDKGNIVGKTIEYECIKTFTGTREFSDMSTNMVLILKHLLVFVSFLHSY